MPDGLHSTNYNEGLGLITMGSLSTTWVENISESDDHMTMAPPVG